MKYEVREYKDFTKEEREKSQQIWESFLNDYCPCVGDTDCRPCDLGVPCDNCHYDYELQKGYVEYRASEGFPITPKEEDKYLKVDIEVECYLCKDKHTLRVKEEDYEEYLKPPGERRYIQAIFPYLKPSERELLISHTCDKCWHYLFSEEEEQTNE